jgi:hypothetical protein
MPRDPPVTTALFPVRSIMDFRSSWSGAKYASLGVARSSPGDRRGIAGGSPDDRRVIEGR